MATLFETASNARKALLAFLIFAILVIAWESVSQLFNRPSTGSSPQFSYYKDPDLALQNVPRVTIDAIKTNPAITPNYSIDRLSNALVAGFPDTAYVYKIEQPRERLTTIEDAVKTAAVLGFKSQCVPVQELPNFSAVADRCTYDGDEYTWVASEGTKTLKFNKTTQQWDLTTDWFNNINVKTLGTLNTNLTSYINSAGALVNRLGFSNNAGLQSPYVEYVPADLNNAGAFFKPERDIQARFVFLEVYRRLRLADVKTREELGRITTDTNVLNAIPAAVEGIVYKSDPRNGSLRVIIGNNLSDYPRDVFSLQFTDYEYATRGVTKGVYPIIDLREAWNKAQSGNGFLVNLLPENGNPLETYENLSVRSFIADATRTTLGFYEPDNWNGFVMPIFIFKGRAVLEDGRQASFTIFVDALKRLE